MSSALFRLVMPLAAMLAMACATPTSPSLNFKDQIAVEVERGQRIHPEDVIILLDSSGSQEEVYNNAKGAAGSFVTAMPKGKYNAGSIVFGGSQRAGQALSSFSRAPLKSSVTNTPHMGGYTPIPTVLAEAQEALGDRRGDVAVMLFSDGLPAEGSIIQPSHGSASAASNLVGQRPADKVCIHTVQTGDSEVGKQVLERLAAASDCGSYRSAASLQSAGSMISFAEMVMLEGEAQRAAPPVIPAAPGDADGDGVVDARDACPRTPRGAPVNSRGCWEIEDLNFAFDSAKIERRYDDRLATAIRVMRENPQLRVRLEGHTDSQGAAAYNQGLSERRAKAVYDYIVAAGINPVRLEWRGFGESNPIASNDTEAGRAENRRIQAKILNR